MLEELSVIQNFPWDIITLSVFCIMNFVFIIRSKNRFQALEESQIQLNAHLLELAGDVKALYESGTNLGGKLKSLEYGSKMLKEEQEKLSLKEPSQQMYRNAVQQINNGESVNKISESSGLSRGEVELLKLFQKINTESKISEIDSVIS
ncbi:MAG: DUF2802 domain-containing protein [Gammaproteobacteria bacterium]|nr:DUF2802 domain-containing protein [Gammaproteobacteria bacterium]